MKVEIVATPQYWITLQRKDVELLIEKSRDHYDNACRSVGRPGGFLYGWMNHFYSPYMHESRVMASFRDIDICLKILELPVQFSHPGAKELFTELSKILRYSNRINWEAHVFMTESLSART